MRRGAGDMPLAEVDRRVTNLHRIRDNRLQAEKRAYERQIRGLEEQVRTRFGNASLDRAITGQQ